MSLSTSFRFEMSKPKQSLAYQKQVERIQRDEEMAERQNQVRRERNENLKAEWNESLEEASWNRQLKEDEKRIKGELRIAKRAVTEVRTMALKQLLEKEWEQYEKELEAKGKTFYKQRL